MPSNCFVKKDMFVERGNMDYLIKKAEMINGTTTVPGDKSISHRALMFSSICNGKTQIKGLSSCDDVQSTRKCMQDLGIEISTENEIVSVHGKGLSGLCRSANILDVGNSGTTIRLLSGILAGQNFDTIITGDKSIQKRPMKRIIEPLRLMNAEIYGADDKFAPLTINKSKLKYYNHILSIASAQVKSCILLAGMYTDGMTTITEPAKSRNHTENMLSYLGANILEKDTSKSIKGFPELIAAPLVVPGDISSSAFFIIAASILKNSNLRINNVGVNPSRTGIIDVLIEMNGNVEIKNKQYYNNEAQADIFIKDTELKGIEIGGAMIPRIIDEIPVLAVAATQATGKTIIKDATELRVKETDRIAAVVENLKKMGAKVIDLPDGMIIEGCQKLKGAEIACYGDHRIAMAFAIAGLIADGETIIKDGECANVSHPGFFEQLNMLSTK